MIYVPDEEDPKTTLIDMDDTILHLVQQCVEIFNAEHGTSYTKADLTGWDHPAVEGTLNRPHLFRDLLPYEGAVENIERLRARRPQMRILFLTSPWGPESAVHKYEWLRRYFPWSSHRDVFLAHEKFRVAGDFLVDDSPKHLRRWSKHWPSCRALCVAQPYNTDVPDGVLRFEGWQDTARAWTGIVDFILEHS
jgi:5'(3')-deoxyribonucleotidase